MAADGPADKRVYGGEIAQVGAALALKALDRGGASSLIECAAIHSATQALLHVEIEAA